MLFRAERQHSRQLTLTDLGQPARCWAKDLAQPALSGVAIQRAALGPFEPGAIFAQVVEKETSLVLEGRNARQSLELSGVEAPGGYRQLQPESAVAGRL